MIDKKDNKKAQEEMVGFVFIIILVAVIAVVFLGIALRKPQSQSFKESQEIQNFLESLRQYTTICQTNLGYATIEELADMCYNNDICLNKEEKEACGVLETELKGILKASFLVSEEAPVKAYNMSIFYEESWEEEIEEIAERETREILGLTEGSCSTPVRKSNEISFTVQPSGNLIVRLELCYNS